MQRENFERAKEIERIKTTCEDDIAQINDYMNRRRNISFALSPIYEVWLTEEETEKILLEMRKKREDKLVALKKEFEEL